MWHTIKNYRPHKIEVIGTVGVILGSAYWIYEYGYGWRVWAYIIASVAFGAMSGYMLHDVWLPPPRRKPTDKTER